MISFVMPNIIATARYIKIAALKFRARIVIKLLTGFLSLALIVASISRIVATWHRNSEMWLISGAAEMSAIAANLFLLITNNFLLLWHVLSTRMAIDNRTHRNEQKTTKTILIVNFCLLITWLPDTIFSICSYLVFLGAVNIPSATSDIIGHLSNYSQLGVVINGGLNACIYIIRVPQLRTLYRGLINARLRGQ